MMLDVLLSWSSTTAMTDRGHASFDSGSTISSGFVRIGAGAA
jgi:hypothetical protein